MRKIVKIVMLLVLVLNFSTIQKGYSGDLSCVKEEFRKLGIIFSFQLWQFNRKVLYAKAYKNGVFIEDLPVHSYDGDDRRIAYYDVYYPNDGFYELELKVSYWAYGRTVYKTVHSEFLVDFAPRTGWVQLKAEPMNYAVYGGSGVTHSSDGKMYYVNSSRQVCNLYQDANGDWKNYILNPNAPHAAGKGIEYHESGLYYITTSGGISRLYYANGQWNHEEISNGRNYEAHSGSRLQVESSTKIYYVNSDRNMSYAFKQNGWTCGVISTSQTLHEYLPFVEARNAIYYYSGGTKMIKSTWDGSRWETVYFGNPLIGNKAPHNKTLFVKSPDESRIYYMNTDYRLCYFDVLTSDAHCVSTVWPRMKLNTAFTVGSNYIYYVNDQNDMYLTWYTGSRWMYERLNSDCWDDPASLAAYEIDGKVFHISRGNLRNWSFFEYANEELVSAAPIRKADLKSQEYVEDTYSDSFEEHVFEMDEEVAETILYPNPARNELNVSANGITKVAIHNSLGSAVLEEYFTGENKVVITISDLPTGVYIATVTTKKSTEKVTFLKE